MRNLILAFLVATSIRAWAGGGAVGGGPATSQSLSSTDTPQFSGLGIGAAAAANQRLNANSAAAQTAYTVQISSQDGSTILLGVTGAQGTLIRGTIQGDTVGAGNVGELLSNNLVISGTSGTPGSSGAYMSISTITLTAGEWDISATGGFTAGATTAATDLGFAISSSNNSRDATNQNNISSSGSTLVVSVNSNQNLGPRRVRVTTNTLYYLVGQLTFTVLGGGVYTTDSIIRATRVR